MLMGLAGPRLIRRSRWRMLLVLGELLLLLLLAIEGPSAFPTQTRAVRSTALSSIARTASRNAAISRMPVRCPSGRLRFELGCLPERCVGGVQRGQLWASPEARWSRRQASALVLAVHAHRLSRPDMSKSAWTGWLMSQVSGSIANLEAKRSDDRPDAHLWPNLQEPFRK
jgi:hypothetical protein